MNAVDTRALKRARMTESLADIVLAEGLDALSLRPAAARLGTSDRMLLYYYGTKAALLDAALTCIAGRFSAYLASTTGNAKVPPQNMVGHAANAMATAEGRPFVQFWLEVAARAARGDRAYKEIAVTIGELWNDWIVRSVHFPAGVTARNAAAMMLAIVNGITLLDLSSPAVGEAARTRVQLSA
jgi:AcrR family transcriptional regulator